MLREQAQLFNRIAMLLDLLVLLVSLLFAYHIVSLSTPLQNITAYLWILVLVFPLWWFFLHRYKLYGSIRRLSLVDIFLYLVRAQISASLILGFSIWFLDKDHFSRSLYVVFISLSFVLLLVEKIVTRKILGMARRRDYNSRNLLIVGTKEKAHSFHDLLELHDDWGLNVIGFLQALEDEPLMDMVYGHKVLGYVSDLLRVCKQYPIDEVVFCLPKDLIVDAEQYLQNLEELGITVRMVLDYYDLKYTKKKLDLFHGNLPILTFYSKNLNSQQLLLKRILDLLGALGGLFILLVLFPFIAIMIKRDSPGPLFFGQERVGESGRRFKCWKFRSMHIDAEERKQELLDKNEMNGAIFKIKNDPRVTHFGSFLRKASLDELPQFWNVLRGEMSLVGTRPPTPEEVEEYANWHRRRISIKPGITGIWQVSGRNNINDFDAIVRLDIAYIDSWSIWLDIKILLQTIKVVFSRKGSY